MFSTDVYFNEYPEYNVSYGSNNASFHLLNRRILKCLSSNLIRNIGLTTTEINNAPQYLLTDVEKLQRHCIFWGGWNAGYGKYFYTSDRYVVPGADERHDSDASYVLTMTNMFYHDIHGVHFWLLDNNIVYIPMNPALYLTLL